MTGQSGEGASGGSGVVWIELKSEFARVRVALDTSANGPRLVVEDMKTGSRLYIDPLELEGIATATHEDLAHLLHPSRRWPG